MEVTGKIINVGELKQISETFKLIEFVVRTDEGEYSQEVLFQSTQDKADKFLQFNKVGDEVTVSFNVRGRSWLKGGEDESKRRWFNSLDAWMVKKSDIDAPTAATAQVAAPATDEAFDDGLPF